MNRYEESLHILSESLAYKMGRFEGPESYQFLLTKAIAEENLQRFSSAERDFKLASECIVFLE